MKKLGALLLTFLLVLVGCSSVKVTKVNDDNETDALRFYKEYPLVKENNVYKYTTYDNVIELITEGSGVIYLGFPTCPWCKELTPILNEVAKEKSVKEVFYYNFKDIRENNTDEYKKLVTLLSEYIGEDKEGNKRISAPSTIFVKNGKIKGVHVGTVDSHDAHERTMTDEEKSQLKTILSNYFDEIYNDECDC